MNRDEIREALTTPEGLTTVFGFTADELLVFADELHRHDNRDVYRQMVAAVVERDRLRATLDAVRELARHNDADVGKGDRFLASSDITAILNATPRP